jgi:exodeoxyribonuclease V beta subunit
MARTLDLANHELTNGHTIEASAGTGKTYSIAALVTRAIAIDDNLRIDKVLITTFTRFAAAELRDRVRRRLVDTADNLQKNQPDPTDPILIALLANEPERSRYIRNLRRAAVNFDNATIGTIHSICSKILALAGLVTHDNSAEELTQRAIVEVVNDRLVSEAVERGRAWDDVRVRKALEARLGSPLAEQWYDDTLDPTVLAELADLGTAINDMVDEVHRRTELHPSFDDLIRRAENALSGEMGDDIRTRLAERYTHAFIDEAQDTDQLQWKLFHHIFPRRDPTSAHKLTAVGDPKQAIYAFRGADIHAYLDVRDPSNMSTLDTNFRSDPPVIHALNALFEGKSLGEGIVYARVSADPGKTGSKVRGIAAAEAIDIADMNNQFHASLAVVGHVVRLLEKGEILDNDGWRPIESKDVCVLAGSNTLVRAVHRELQRLGIPAVASGAESVFADSTASELRRIFEALDRVNNLGRVRSAASTTFFGMTLGDPRLLPDDVAPRGPGEPDAVLDIQEKLVEWRQILQRRGVAALASEISGDKQVMESFVAGPDGERHLADFSHIVDLLHAETRGSGVTPSQLLEVFDAYALLSGNSEVVSRRVESDIDAVQVMTVHKAKGLEFPCVIVAELWKPKTYEEHRDIPKYHHPIKGDTYQNRIDIGWVLGHTADESKSLVTKAQCDEQKRLIYVAFTRPKNHLAFLRQSQLADESMLLQTVDLGAINREGTNGEVLVAPVARTYPPRGWRYADAQPSGRPEHLVANGPSAIEQTYRRTSFSGITKAQSSMTSRVDAADFAPLNGGTDEASNWLVTTSRYAGAETPTGVHMPLARIAGGVYVGRVLHEIYECVDTSAPDLRSEVEAQCRRIIRGGLLGSHLDAIIDGVHLSLATPLGPSLGNVRLAGIPPERRLAELNFEMSIADLAAGVRVSDFGRILDDLVPVGNVLRPYVDMLLHESFDIPLAGLINGSIDAVLQLGTDDDPQIWITDYKSNRLDQDGDATIISAYGQERLFDAMVHHHYPLQALIYGTAMYRYLRWRAPHLANPSNHVKGFSYFFVRGMVGPDTPSDTGVFTWLAPDGLWQGLSDRLAGDSR